jgi:hypothetical protein
MRTTLDLPADVANTLRMESARRGGRRKASLSILVSVAVRKTYGSTKPRIARRKIDLTAGRVVIGGSADAPLLTADRVNTALYD